MCRLSMNETMCVLMFVLAGFSIAVGTTVYEIS